MRPLAGILALLIGIAGWYYLFYSPATHRLATVENPETNLRRRKLRRVNGSIMLVLAVLFYAGFYAVDEQEQPGRFMLVWLAVFVLLFFVVYLAVADLRLTAQLRRRE